MSDASSAIARAGSPTVCDSYERGSIDEPLRDRWIPVFESIVTAHVALQAGKLDAAEAAARSALAAVRAHPDPEPELLAGALGALGLVQAERRQFTDARATLNEAIRLATHAREDKIVVDSWNAILLMGVRGDDKDVDAAIFGAEVAASRLPEDDPSRCMVAAANASTIALADFTMARTLVSTGGSKPRAIELAQHALAKLAGHPFAIHRREIEAWLATHR